MMLDQWKAKNKKEEEEEEEEVKSAQSGGGKDAPKITGGARLDETDVD